MAWGSMGAVWSLFLLYKAFKSVFLKKEAFHGPRCQWQWNDTIVKNVSHTIWYSCLHNVYHAIRYNASLTHCIFSYFLPLTCFLFFEVPYFDRGWSYLISIAFFIIYLIFLSWFRNPLKSCRNTNNSFQVFQSYIKTSALYISLSFTVLFSLDFWYCFAWSLTFYDIPFCIQWIFFSYFVCAPHFTFLRLYFPPSPYCVYVLFYCNSGKIHCLSRSHWHLSHMPKLGFESWQWWETASSQWQSHTAQCTVYTHCVAKCALPVCCVISAALGQLTAMLFKNIVSIGFKQGISVDPLMWPISQVMWRELLVAS